MVWPGQVQTQGPSWLVSDGSGAEVNKRQILLVYKYLAWDCEKILLRKLFFTALNECQDWKWKVQHNFVIVIPIIIPLRFIYAWFIDYK